jgi:6-phosphogluconolactonase (cycloisomerase 2 family)
MTLKQLSLRILILTFSVVSLFSSGALASSGDGALYTATNAAAGNAVLIFDRHVDGSLTAAGSVSTGGLGLGIGLGNQNGISLTRDHEYLFVVNAGSNEISSFAVESEGLRLVDKVFSGGLRPISLATHGRLLFVLNAGGQAGDADNITGFSIRRDGTLSPIAGSARPLSDANTNPAQIAFNDDGDLLVVTEKGTNRIVTFTLHGDDEDELRLSGPNVSASSGAVPFGFDFGKRNQLIVSEAPGSAASSYKVSGAGELRVISGSVPDLQGAACWLVVTNDGRYAYVANAATANVSGYAIDHSGRLTLLNADGITGTTAPGPIDETLSSDGRYLYTLNARSGSISAFEILSDGSLRKLPETTLPTGTNGLAAR